MRAEGKRRILTLTFSLLVFACLGAVVPLHEPPAFAQAEPADQGEAPPPPAEQIEAVPPSVEQPDTSLPPAQQADAPALPVERTDTPPPPTVQTDVPPPSTEQTGAPTPAPTPSGPRIVFPEPVYDFGTVEQGEQITHLFRFINQGEQDLRIADVKTSCGCTAAIISANVIPPGQEGTISATFETARFIGEKVKNVTVYSNDPLQSVTTLTLQGEITVEIAPEPAQLYLGRPHRSEEVTQTVEVLYDAGKPISITKVENTHPAVRVQTEDLEKGNKKGKKLTVTLKKGAAIGRLNDQITVTTTSQKIPTLTIPVFGSIEGDVLVQPPQVSFGTIRQGESRAREVRIKSRAASPVRVLRVESSAANVVPEVTEVKQGEEYRLTLKTKSDGKPGRIQGEVQVFTDHPEEKMLTIPLYGVVGGA